MTPRINNGREDCIIGEKGIKYFEEKYNATYIADLCLKDKDGNWMNEPSAIFYQKTPPDSNFSHYFAIISRDKKILITSGDSAVSEPIVGIQSNDGEIIFSRYRHDHRVSKDRSVFIDGGRDYTKNSGGTLVKIHIVNGEMTFNYYEHNMKLKS